MAPVADMTFKVRMMLVTSKKDTEATQADVCFVPIADVRPRWVGSPSCRCHREAQERIKA